jgi:transposase-like protein
MDAIEGVGYALRSKRRHGAEFKARVIEACRHPGVSIAAVALDHRLNAN